MAKSARPDAASELPDIYIERAPISMATLEGPMHIVRCINPPLCRLLGKSKDDAVGKPFHDLVHETGACRDLLDRVYLSGDSESRTSEQRSEGPAPFPTYAVWPVVVDGLTLGLVIQVFEAGVLREKILAMNEALMLGALRQHEEIEAADLSNVQLQHEIGASTQREADARMLATEVAHRVKNNLQIVATLIAYEARQAPPSCADGYSATQSRIRAISELYDLISESDADLAVNVGDYLAKIAKILSTSLLESTSQISIAVEAEELDIEPDRAVPMGLLVNELVTNAIKHAFPGGIGRVVVGARQADDHIELTIADDGVGLKAPTLRTASEKHGADYVAIFARQLGGTVTVSESTQGGTLVHVRIPRRSPPIAP